MSNYLVTGGAGFIGAAIADRLLKAGNQVMVADNLSTGKIENIPSGCSFLKMDLSQEHEYVRLNDQHFDAVFHLAAQSSGEASFDDPSYDMKSHVVSTFLLLEHCRKKNIKRFLYASSMSVYGDVAIQPVKSNEKHNPKTFYGVGKAAAEKYINFYSNYYGINATIFRMFSVYGPNQNLDNLMQGMISIYLAYLIKDMPIIVKGSKERYRDFIYIEDVVTVWVTALNSEATYGKTYNLGSGVPTTVEKLLQVLLQSVNKTEHPINYLGGTPGDQFGMYADIQALQSELGWRPAWTLESGVPRMVEFFKNLNRPKSHER
ncbi:NAD-dependent epimerase/dehydratase family protein [Polynucleobacter sp. MWH-UH2A]|uniref:NAD-dependent epimerase/dehydratase family protein n=1 Tax=Polynucleobacter sp. MWH-UH2A TaxID=1855617 RepID=UPI001BFE6B64|nr:NAD-dependent epimerase/dehydratase family protein [Polynucleobacter sp. MWH-UH2A]QWD64372.1 NAD-dependent epimerase/dehydratase family protein [Polynucleobacter sp. MWH-UH2A]